MPLRDVNRNISRTRQAHSRDTINILLTSSSRLVRGTYYMGSSVSGQDEQQDLALCLATQVGKMTLYLARWGQLTLSCKKNFAFPETPVRANLLSCSYELFDV